MDPPNGASRPDAPRAVLAELRHLESLVTCHMESMPDWPISQLGRAFVRAHYRYYIERPEGFVVVAVDGPEEKVTGFMLGGAPRLRRRFIRSHLLRFAGATLLRAVVNPAVRRRLVEGAGRAARKLLARFLRRPVRGEADHWPRQPPGSYARVLFVATHPDYRRRGIGRAILRRVEQQCAAMGFSTVRLKTRNVNEAAIAMYKRLGWRQSGRDATHTYFWRPIDRPAATGEASAGPRGAGGEE
ncbi:MAG: GNAT family N-acetyltransferase [Planctomycetes bacterium]|nr:GNAT family N-acetyltransferase [Planctomycetota bacterium]